MLISMIFLYLFIFRNQSPATRPRHDWILAGISKLSSIEIRMWAYNMASFMISVIVTVFRQESGRSLAE